MDPTAPDNNDKNQQNPQGTQSPIQPGQFVVATQDSNGQQSPTGVSPLPSVPANQSSVPPTGSSPYQPPPAGDGFTTDSNLQTRGPVPPPPQPDPAPFTPPPQPVNPIGAPTDDSKSSKVKIIGIAAGIISLLVIIAALIWFFIINKKTTEPASTTSQEIIEEPSQATKSSGSFGQINESTAEASPLQSPVGSDPTAPPPDSATSAPPTQ